MSDLEIRQLFGRVAAPTAGDGSKLSGRAMPFMSPTMIGKPPWGFREQIKPTAVNKTIKDGDQVLLDNHDASRPLARASAGSFELHAGRTGADWQAQTADTTYAQDVVKNVRAGLYGGCSFSFEVVSDTWDEGTDDGIPLRTLNEINVREVSICTFPAYADTSVQARSIVDRAMEFRAAWYERELLEWHPEGRASDGDSDDKKPYGDVEYADPKNGKYPIDTKAHAKAALSYISMPKNAAKYPMNGVSLASVKAKIVAACKKFGVDVSDSKSAPEPDNSRVFETEDYRIVSTGDWNDRQWDEFLNELKWINKISADGEPDTPTRLTKEETALLNERAASLRRSIFESRKPSFKS